MQSQNTGDSLHGYFKLFMRPSQNMAISTKTFPLIKKAVTLEKKAGTGGRDSALRSYSARVSTVTSGRRVRKYIETAFLL